MTCASIRGELVGFHFGVIDEAPRAAVEQHLASCAGCLGEFLALKRDVELAASAAERPRAQVRTRLRAAVAQELGLVAGPAAWWQRPLAFGLAAAAVVLAMVTVDAVATAAPTAPVGLSARLEP
ncbi:MAG: zf-HC2 domain-containing protein [Myxococcus sp.]|nr:zf-HC2 domain-containing protein [Myxococcus sp.]